MEMAENTFLKWPQVTERHVVNVTKILEVWN